MRSSWLNDTVARLILGAMMPENRLALEVSDATGLRIDDVLSLKTETVARTARPYVVDSKTGKRHRVYIPAELRERMLKQAGKVWVWPGRIEPLTKHRTRQTVWKDMKQAVAIFRRNKELDEAINPSPHSMRKRAAVRAFQDGGLEAAAAILNHSGNDAAVTLLYALSDQPAQRKSGRKGRTKRRGGH